MATGMYPLNFEGRSKSLGQRFVPVFLIIMKGIGAVARVGIRFEQGVFVSMTSAVFFSSKMGS